MKKFTFIIAPITAIALMVFTGCQGGMCTNCGAGYSGFPSNGYPPTGVPANTYQQPPTTWTSPQGATIQPPPGTMVQPGMPTPQPGVTYGQQPGVVLPQQVAPVQSQPGTVYGTGQ